MKINKDKFELYQARECLENKELLEKAGICLGVLRDIKSGKAKNLRPKTVGKIAKALNVDVSELIEQ